MTRPPLVPRPGYEGLRAYAPGVGSCAIDLSDNTNLWGASPAALRALAGASDVTRYPSLYGAALKQAIAARHGVDPEMIVTGAGSDGVLEPAIRAFAQPGDRMAVPDPTFVMAAAFGTMNGLVPCRIPLLADYDVDAEAMLATGARVIYLCSPNNPTGRALSRAQVERVVAAAPGLVIIDEAYAEFAPQDALPLLADSEHVLITRTFSKAYGLASLRVGYGIAAPALVQAIEKARGPYTVNAYAERAAIAAIGDGHGWMCEHVGMAIDARARFRAGLEAIGLEPVVSDANFLFVPLRDSRRVAEHLASRGIAVRAFAGLAPVSPALAASGGDALRITVGPEPMMQAAVDALAGALHGGPR